MSHEDIRAESLTRQVFALLKRQISNGRLRPGERILEKELARRLGISRTPIREALLKLEVTGLVVCNTHRSYHIRALTVHDVKEIYEALGVLEGAMVATAAGDITPQDLGLLERYNTCMKRAAARGGLQAFGSWNRKFHEVLLSKYKNRTLLQVCDLVRQRLYTFPVRRGSLREWLMKSVEEHREIIRLARAKDAGALARYFRNVHWDYQQNLPFIQDAFDREGEAAIHF